MTTPQTAAAAPAPALPKSVTPVAAATAALAKEMAAEASKAGVSVIAGIKSGAGEPAKPPPWEREDEPAEVASDAQGDDDDDDAPAAAADGEAAQEPPKAASGASDAKLAADIKAALDEKDTEALGKALGADLFELLQIKPDDFKAIRHDKKKARQVIDEATKATENLNALEGKLREKYSDPVTARKAFQSGDLDVFFDTVTKWSGVPYVEVQKAWALHVQGKPVPALKFADPEADTRAAEAKQAEESKAAEATKKADAMKWVSEGIKGDKLAAEPGIADRVFEKLRVKWNDGVRTPAKALELVKADIVEENKAQRARLRSAGLLPKKGEPAPRGHGHSPPKAGALTTATAPARGKARAMTDAELANDVLGGLDRTNWHR